MTSELYQNIESGELFEIISFLDNSVCARSVADGKYAVLAKPIIDDYKISWRWRYDSNTKQESMKTAKEINDMYNDFADRFKIMDITKDIDSCVVKNSENFHYELGAAYDELINNGNSNFDIACAVALTIRQHNYNGRDIRFDDDAVEWAENFIDTYDVDFNNYRSTPLCSTHPIVLNGFAKVVKERFSDYSRDNDIDLTNNSGLSR